MKSGIVALAIAAVGAAHLVQRDRHHKENKRLRIAQWHDRRVGELAENPAALGEMYTEITDLSEKATILRQNQWLCMWSAMFRLGYINENHLRENAKRFMQDKAGRLYWSVGGEHRMKTAQDAHDIKFTQVMDEAYQAELGAAA
ncbi:DUF6082 family protein [Streptomyces misionensis]|uniref:DUF6082 family protein n=1 Tax=Streptomyces misionensis TaxID=67331 RepID=UPI003685E486